MRDSDPDVLEQLPYLKVLEISLWAEQMELDDKLPWLDHYTDLEIARIPLVRSLLGLRGLKTVKVLDSPSYRGISAKEEHRWSRFRKRVEKLLTDVITKPKSVSGVGVHRSRPRYLQKSGLSSKYPAKQAAYDIQQQRS